MVGLPSSAVPIIGVVSNLGVVSSTGVVLVGLDMGAICVGVIPVGPEKHRGARMARNSVHMFSTEAILF